AAALLQAQAFPGKDRCFRHVRGPLAGLRVPTRRRGPDSVKASVSVHATIPVQPRASGRAATVPYPKGENPMIRYVLPVAALAVAAAPAGAEVQLTSAGPIVELTVHESVEAEPDLVTVG